MQLTCKNCENFSRVNAKRCKIEGFGVKAGSMRSERERAAVSNLPLWGRGTTEWWMRFSHLSVTRYSSLAEQRYSFARCKTAIYPRGGCDMSPCGDVGRLKEPPSGREVARLCRDGRRMRQYLMTLGGFYLNLDARKLPHPLRGSSLSEGANPLTATRSCLAYGRCANEIRQVG